MRFKSLMMVLTLPGFLVAQSAVYVPYRNSSMWSAETLYVGASFLYTGATSSSGKWWSKKFGSVEPITITLKGNEADWRGDLYAIVQSATGVEETVFLFNNHDPKGTSFDLRSKVSFPIPSGAEITFMYKVTASGSWWPVNAVDKLPKYSGPNRGSDRYHSVASSDSMPNANWRFGNRWSVVGRNPDGDLEFGFEDCTQPSLSDMDFDDVVFTVSNLEIGIFKRKLLAKDLVR
jgi:hypothetical protein